MNIYICVGSSCHLKGSHNIIELMKASVSRYQLEDKINLSAAFCLGHCTDGVTVKIDDEIICGISEGNFNEFFEKNILPRVNRSETQ